MSGMNRVTVEREGQAGAVFRIEGMLHGLSLHGARRLANELEERIVGHELAYAKACDAERSGRKTRFRLHTPLPRS